MYQDFFNLYEYPFNQFPNTDFYFNLENHKQSLDVLSIGLEVDDGIVKITGKSGTGKSLLCRLFVDRISDNYCPIYIINPYFCYFELLQHILTELKVNYSGDDNGSKLSKLLYAKALELKKQKKKLVLIFDEAQYISQEGLEAIQIISNFECDGEKLCQIVIVGGLDLDENIADFHHFLQRIAFSYILKPITQEDLENYIYHRLSVATRGNQNHGIIFMPSALNMLYKKTQGIPRLINIVCHKSLMLAYSLGSKKITKNIIKQAAQDTDFIKSHSLWRRVFSFVKNKNDQDTLVV